jgi:hypothetical protein
MHRDLGYPCGYRRGVYPGWYQGESTALPGLLARSEGFEAPTF